MATMGRRGFTAVLVSVLSVGSLLASGVSSAGATVTQLPPVQPAGGGFMDTARATGSSSIALDGAGGTHVASEGSEAASSTNRITYAYCPPGPDCVSPAQWAQVDVAAGLFAVQITPQVKLTPAGQPRILFGVGDSSYTTSFRYAACDSACTTPGSWTVLDLASLFSRPLDFTGSYQDHSFALDSQGRPRFVYKFSPSEGGQRLAYAFCDAGCAASTSNWAQTTVSQGTGALPPDDLLGVRYESLSLEFTTTGNPRVSGWTSEIPRLGSGVQRITYVACDSACEVPEPLPPAAPNWTVTGVATDDSVSTIPSVVLALDRNNAPHLIVGGTADIAMPLLWLSCSSACSMAPSWSNNPMGISGSDAVVVFDRHNWPRVVFHSSPALGSAWCNAACDTAGAQWQTQVIDDSRAFQATFATVGSCAGRPPAGWLVGYHSWLTLDAAGNPRVTFAGHHIRWACTGDSFVTRSAVRVDRFNFFPRVADFDASTTTDVSVFRPSGGTWFARGGATTAWGTSGDIPVPSDYDGNGGADLAVFRPSTGTWFVRGGVSTAWGTSGDTPVPGDYAGDGTADFAVFRPSTGTWFVRGGPTVAWGAAGDIPVPGDYNGDHITDIAVFRPSTGTWFVRNGAAVGWGASGDIPVPGDYDGDGDTDMAVFRPSNGTWFVQGGPASPWGTSGDVPSPGDYDGDGDVDVAVFRPSNGTWFVQGGLTVGWGTSTDIPLPLPHAIRRAFFPAP